MVEFFPVDTEKSKGIADANIASPPKPVRGCFTALVIDGEELINVISRAGGRKRKMRVLHRSMRIVLVEPESSIKVGFGARTKKKVKIGCSSIHVFYSFDTSDGKDLSVVRLGLFARRPCV